MKICINLYACARNPQNAPDSECCVVIVHTTANQRLRVCAAGTVSTVDYTITITPCNVSAARTQCTLWKLQTAAIPPGSHSNTA